MKIEIKMRIDERKQMPYWSARAIHEGKVLLEVVSQTFDDSDDMDVKRRYQNACVKMIRELTERIQSNHLLTLLAHEPSAD